MCSHEGGSLTRLDFDQEGQKRQRKKGRTFENRVNFIGSLIVHNLSIFFYNRENIIIEIFNTRTHTHTCL